MKIELTGEMKENPINPIRHARMKHGLTQAQLAQITGIPKRSIENWEGGQRKCPEYVINMIQNKLIMERHKSDLVRLHNYLMDHEDTDTALMKNAGLDTYPSTILEELKEGK